MIKKELEKKNAIALRRQGQTYSEILAKIPVAKSTLSLWLHEVGIAKHQMQQFTEKKRLASQRGGLAKRSIRIEQQVRTIASTSQEIGVLSSREKLLVGAALYWAEGAKQKEHNVSQQVCFGNSDPNMIEFFLNWLAAVRARKEDVYFELYIHKDADYKKAVVFWSNLIKKPTSIFEGRVYFKKGNPSTFRKNKGEKYYGLLRIKVLRSTDLNRRIEGWIKGIVENTKAE